MRRTVAAGAAQSGADCTALPPLTEKQFQQQVLDLAKLTGWRAYHTFDSRRSAAGFLDLTIVHARRRLLVFAELKTDEGLVTSEQRAWLADLRACGQVAVAWTPSDWPDIQALLTGQG